MKDKFYHIDDDLLVKYLLGECTPVEIARVEQWIAEDRDNEKYYDDFKLIWEESKQFAITSEVDENASWQRLRNRIQGGVPGERPRIKKIAFYSRLKIAAMLVIITGAALITYIIFGNTEIRILAVKSQKAVVTDTLPDGSIVTLNKNSKILFPEKFSGDSRTISLEGEAFFRISQDKSKPFIIHVNDVTVRVTGTSFNIKSIHGNTEVIVETGTVQVIKKNKKTELHPGEEVLVKREDSVLVKGNETGTLYNYYRTKEFECDNTPLWKLVEVLSEAYNTQITIKRRELRNLPLTTTFNNESLDNILEIIRQTFNISVTKNPGGFILQ